jgi:light-regulated signal transduction histidine kinase (bacteriophytochrome)
MGQLIDDLLRFSRLNRQPLRRHSVNTTDLVRRVIAELEPELEGRTIDLRVGELPACVGDLSLLHQVWTNLIGNAIKFTRTRDQAIIEIGWRRDDGPVVYYVADNGVGFDMAYTSKLFTVFQRLHSAEEYEGTGAGLAIVQRIVHRHDGRVWADATRDAGATFFFTLGGIADLGLEANYHSAGRG